MRPLWDYPPGEPGSVSEADAIAAYLRAEAMFADPLGMTRAASAALDPANLHTVLASDQAATPTDAPETRVAAALLVDDTPHQAKFHTSDDPKKLVDKVPTINVTTHPPGNPAWASLRRHKGSA